MRTIKEAIAFGLKKIGIKEIREHQRQVIEAYASGKDVFLSAPTGSGKSLTFEICPYIFHHLKYDNSEAIEDICLVVVPLKALMKNQVESLRSKGIKAAFVGEDSCPKEYKEICAGKYNIVFGSPEAFLNSSRSLIRCIRAKIRAVFVDESHCIEKWGIGKKNEDAFRKDYGRIGELRSLLHRSVPFIALTATATENVRQVIIKDLCMNNLVTILGNPNRQNIRYAVADIDSSSNLECVFECVINDLSANGINASKVLVFCRKKEHVKELYEMFLNQLGNRAYHRPTGSEPKDDRSRLFGMYHKKTHKLVKETIENEFCKEDGSVRVIFCTIAFGMGVDVKGAYLAVHLGPSSDLDDYLQESGRIGRSSNTLSHALLLKFKGCTQSRHISKPMKDYIKNNAECRRVALLKPFCASPQPSAFRHSCCDVCAKLCKCQCVCRLESCICDEPCHFDDFQSEMESNISKLNLKAGEKKKAERKVINKISIKKMAHLRKRLLTYRSKLADNVEHEKLFTGLDLTTGYTMQLVDNITKDVKYIGSIEDLKQEFQFFTDNYAVHTWDIISDVLKLSDTDIDDESNTDELQTSSDESDCSDCSSLVCSSDECDSNDSDIVRFTKCRLRIPSSSDESEE